MDFPSEKEFQVNLYGKKPSPEELNKIKNSYSDLASLEYNSDKTGLVGVSTTSESAHLLKRQLDNYFGDRIG